MGFLAKRRRKFLAPFVLALWLFAIFVSVAHACGLDEDFSHAYPSRSASVGGHGSDDGTAPNCAKFCADDFAVLAKLKAIQDLPTGEALLTQSFVNGSLQGVVAPILSLLRSPNPPPGIAVNTRFVRLAL